MTAVTFPKKEDWVRAHAQHAGVFFVLDHHAYSRMIAQDVVQRMVAQDVVQGLVSESDQISYDVIAVCGYPPKFFIEGIRSKMLGDHQNTRVQENRALLTELDKPDFLNPDGQPILPDADLAKLKELVQGLAKAVFPHFAAMSSQCQASDLRQVRLCFFGKALNQRTTSQSQGLDFDLAMCTSRNEKKYLKLVKRNTLPGHAYAFYHWLNDDCECFVVKPWRWRRWGLVEESVHDFGIFAQANRQFALARFYEEHKFMIYVNPLNFAWRSLGYDKFFASLSNAEQEECWRFDEFIKCVYFDKPSQRELLTALLKKLKTARVQVPMIERDHCPERMKQATKALNSLERVPERIIEQVLGMEPFKSHRNAQSLMARYRKAPRDVKDYLKKVADFLAQHESSSDSDV